MIFSYKLNPYKGILHKIPKILLHPESQGAHIFLQRSNKPNVMVFFRHVTQQNKDDVKPMLH
jgi:hypothetical protein